jgi:hypothetical protein
LRRTLFLAPFLGLPLPLLPIHILGSDSRTFVVAS